MAFSRPSILVAGNDAEESAAIAAMLREAGFAAVLAGDEHSARAAILRRPFAAAVIALPGMDGVEFAAWAAHEQPGFRALAIVEPRALRLIDGDCTTLIRRPFDPRQLLGCLFELVLRDDGEPAREDRDAELGIAAAELACLSRRQEMAAAAGAGVLAKELARRIRDLRLVCGTLSTERAAGAH